MEDQFIYIPIRAAVELHPEALELVDDEGSALVGTEFVGWLAPNCQRQLFIVVLPDNNRRASPAERAGAVLTEGRIRAIADRAGTRVKTMSLTSGSKGAARLAMFPSRSVENEIEPVGQQTAGRLGHRPNPPTL
jgi:hypothetical protein